MNPAFNAIAPNNIEAFVKNVSGLPNTVFKTFSEALAQKLEPEQRAQLKEDLHTVFRLKDEDIEKIGEAVIPTKATIATFIELTRQGSSHIGNFIDQVKAKNSPELVEARSDMLKRLKSQVVQTLTGRKTWSIEDQAKQIYGETMFALTGKFPERPVEKATAKITDHEAA